MPELRKIVEAAIWEGLRSEEVAARLRPVVDSDGSGLDDYNNMAIVAAHVVEVIREAFALIELDRVADAGYLHLTHRPVGKTIGIGVAPSINVDLDKDGGVVGVELLSIPAEEADE